MFQPEGSNKGVNSGLMIFGPTIVNSGVDSSYYVEYLPANQLSDDGPIEFTIPPNGGAYMDLSKTRLCIKGKIVKSTGEDIVSADVVGPINLFLHTMFRQIDTYLQQKLISSSSTNYAYKAMIDTLLYGGSDYHATSFQSQLFFKDSAGTHNNTAATQTPLNQGFIKRILLAFTSKVFDMEGPIMSDIFQITKYLLNGVELRMKLWQQKNEFRFMWGDNSKKYKLKITEASLKIFYLNLTPGVLVGHAEALKKTNARYHYNKSEIKTYAIARGSYNIHLDDVFQGLIPTKVVVCFVTSQAYAGKNDKNPMKFDHCNLDFLAAYVNGESKPFKPLQPDFSTAGGQQYIKAYETLFPTNEKEAKGTPPISRSDYPLGYTLFVFDIEQHNDVGHFPPIRHGNFRIEGHFASSLDETINVLVYGKFPSVLEIDSTRNVYL